MSKVAIFCPHPGNISGDTAYINEIKRLVLNHLTLSNEYKIVDEDEFAMSLLAYFPKFIVCKEFSEIPIQNYYVVPNAYNVEAEPNISSIEKALWDVDKAIIFKSNDLSYIQAKAKDICTQFDIDTEVVDVNYQAWR